MELKEIMKIQNEFDEVHSSKFEWSEPISENTLDVLSFLIVAITGELGELSNVVKKVLRGDCPLSSVKHQVEDELADIFIYLIKICNQMSIDLEPLYFSKLEQNKKRFRNYEKRTPKKTDEVFNQKIYNLRTIKSFSEDDLEEYLDFFCEKYLNNRDLVKTFEEMFKLKGLINEYDSKTILFIMALSVVLADVGSSMSPFIRKTNIAKIQNICVKKDVNYQMLLSLTSEDERTESLFYKNT